MCIYKIGIIVVLNYFYEIIMCLMMLLEKI